MTAGHAMVTLRDGGDTVTDSALFKMARVEFKYLIFYYLMSILRSSDVKWLRYRPTPWSSASRVEANVNIDLRGLTWPVGQGHVPLSGSTAACTGHSTRPRHGGRQFNQVPSAKAPKTAASHFQFPFPERATTTEQAEKKAKGSGKKGSNIDTAMPIVTSWQVQTSTL